MAVAVSTIVANYKTTLSTKTVVGGTTATLTSNLDKDGLAIPNGFYCFLIDKDASAEEHITCTVTGSALSNVKHLSRQAVETVGFNHVHQIGAEVILTDFSNIKTLSDNAGGGGSIGALLKYVSNFTPTLGLFEIPAWDYIKTYVDGVVVAGAPDASTVTKGITTMSVAPAVASMPIAVGDNDPRIPILTQKNALVGTNGTPDTTNAYVTRTGGDLISPIGSIMDWGSPTPPTNWAILNGQAVSRTTYATLFGILGTTFGVGDGSTTFNIPNAVGRTIVMQDGGQTEFDVMGETGGSKTHTLITAEMPSHDHDFSQPVYSNGFGTAALQYAGLQTASGSVSIDTATTGGNSAHNNLQPYLILSKVIRLI